MKAKIHFFGGTDTVTGSNFLLTMPQGQYLIDCGLFQGSRYASEENEKPFPFDPSKIEILFVTHAHMDHIGRIPKLVKDGFQGIIYSTTETRMIAEPMLKDALAVMRDEEKRYKKIPLYEESDVRAAFLLWKTVDYNEVIDINGIKVDFLTAGHILGSAMVRWSGDKTLMFTGDLGNKNNLLLDEAATPKVDYLVCESVYGDRNHEEPAERKGKLIEAISKTIKKSGVLIIPAFSLERTQHILFEINNIFENKEAEAIPVYLDSPLAIKLTEIYRRSSRLFKEKVREQINGGDDIFDFPHLNISLGREDSMEIYDKPNPKIILAGSGMSMGGRVIHHEKQLLGDSRTTMLFVGYQSAGSLGRRISEGDKSVKIDGEEIRVKAEVMQVEGYSSHRDSDGLVEFVSKVKPERVFVVMGEPKTSSFLAQRLREDLEVEAQVPEKDSSFEFEI